MIGPPGEELAGAGYAVEVIDTQTAQLQVRVCAMPGPTESAELPEAAGRVLADAVRADLDYPPFDRAMMDGYAVMAGPAEGAAYHIVGQIGAGSLRSDALRAGQAVQINTGAPIPPGSDTVVPVEQAQLAPDGRTVSFTASFNKAQHIARRGEYAAQGQVVLNPGLRLTAGELAIAAAVGAARLKVFRRPEVAILITGNELVEVDAVPSGAQIRNFNGILLQALITQLGARPKLLGTARDDPSELEALVRQGLQSDVLCLTGGISMGAFDFVPDVLRRCGVELKFQKVAIKPGRPTLFGVAENGCLVFGLSGNPLSAMVGFMLFARLGITLRMGWTDSGPLTTSGILHGRLSASGGQQSYFPARISCDATGRRIVHALPWHGSGDPFGLAGAHALIVRPADGTALEEGSPVEALMLDLFS